MTIQEIAAVLRNEIGEFQSANLNNISQGLLQKIYNCPEILQYFINNDLDQKGSDEVWKSLQEFILAQ